MEHNINQDIGIDTSAAQKFLAEKFKGSIDDVLLVGEGAWSRCFGFCHDGEELVIRFGMHVDDFEKDLRAYQYATPNLPIPEVREIGTIGDLYFAISTRVHGVPLETINTEQWRSVVPSLAAAMEAMRLADISSTLGFGGWGQDGNAQQQTWSERMLSVNEDNPEHRTYGWRQRLADTSPEGNVIFARGYNLLKEIVNDDVPRSLLHCDLSNRNVLVADNKISGVFDWGCSIYGDHLYELAAFTFWSPWHPQLDVPMLRAELEKHWHDAGYVPNDVETRLQACYLHIGLEHIAYNAYLGDWDAMLETAKRMKLLVFR